MARGLIAVREWIQRRLNHPRDEHTEREHERIFQRRLRALDDSGRTKGFYSISVDYNLLTSDKILSELEKFRNYVIAVGGDTVDSFRRELNELQVTMFALAQRMNATNSPDESKRFTIQRKALAAYTSEVERIHSSLEQLEAQREQHLTTSDPNF